MNKIIIQFSPTSLDNFLTCKAKYHYANNLRKTLPVFHKAPSLDYGALGHKGLETYYTGLKDNLPYVDRMHNTLMAIKAQAADPSQSNVDSDELTMILNAVETNLDYWRSEDDQLEVLGVEEPFDFILYEDEFVIIVISGKIDLRVNITGIGGNSSYSNLPIDHKFFQRDFPVFRTNNQFITYTIPTQSNYLFVNRVGLQKTVSVEQKFKRVPLSYDADFINSWKSDTIATILNEYLACVKDDRWPVNFTSCHKYNRLCEFHDVCNTSGSKEDKLYKLEANFVDREPFDKYGEEKKGQ